MKEHKMPTIQVRTYQNDLQAGIQKARQQLTCLKHFQQFTYLQTAKYDENAQIIASVLQLSSMARLIFYLVWLQMAWYLLQLTEQWTNLFRIY